MSNPTNSAITRFLYEMFLKADFAVGRSDRVKDVRLIFESTEG